MNEKMRILTHGDLIGFTEKFWNCDQCVNEENCKPRGDKQYFVASCAPIGQGA
jgi:hypothetical protein